jgi:hypothetical protein
MSNSQRLKHSYLLSCPNEVVVFILFYYLQHSSSIIYHLSQSPQLDYDRDHKFKLYVLEFCQRLHEISS